MQVHISIDPPATPAHPPPRFKLPRRQRLLDLLATPTSTLLVSVLVPQVC